jgi:glycine/D-amino acid oxidase-like deaminating enzyme
MTSAGNRRPHDVVVVGARVAGSATAMLLARLGHDVVVMDQASFPSDTVSTHSIARSGVVQLRPARVDRGAWLAPGRRPSPPPRRGGACGTWR